MQSDIILRGHHILCIQHFKGLGYSPLFVANMSSIVNRLRLQPPLVVRLTNIPDDICLACPNLKNGNCHSDGEDAEESRMEQDDTVLKALGLLAGDRLSWGEIMRKLQSRQAFLPTNTCGACRWQESGCCDHINLRIKNDKRLITP